MLNVISGTDRSVPFAAYTIAGVVATTLTAPTVVKYRVNGGTTTTLESPTITAHDADMNTFQILVPAAISTSAGPGGNIEISIVDDIGTFANIIVDVQPDYSLLATAASISALNNISVADITGSDLLRAVNIMLTGSVTGLTAGAGSPVTFTGSDGSTVVFTVDANGNRTISAITLV